MRAGHAAAEKELTAATNQLKERVRSFGRALDLTDTVQRATALNEAVTQLDHAGTVLSSAATKLQGAIDDRVAAAAPSAEVVVPWGKLATDSSAPVAAGEALAAAVKSIVDALGDTGKSSLPDNAKLALPQACKALSSSASALAKPPTGPVGSRKQLRATLVNIAQSLQTSSSSTITAPCPPTLGQIAATLTAELQGPVGDNLDARVSSLVAARALLDVAVSKHAEALPTINAAVKGLSAARRAFALEVEKLNAARGMCGAQRDLPIGYVTPATAVALTAASNKVVAAGEALIAAVQVPGPPEKPVTAGLTAAIVELGNAATGVAGEIGTATNSADGITEAVKEVVSAGTSLGATVRLPRAAAATLNAAVNELVDSGRVLTSIVQRLTKAVVPPATGLQGQAFTGAQLATARALLGAVQQLSKAQHSLKSAVQEPAATGQAISTAAGQVSAARAGSGGADQKLATASDSFTAAVQKLRTTDADALATVAGMLQQAAGALGAVDGHFTPPATQLLDLTDTVEELTTILSAAAKELDGPSCCPYGAFCCCPRPQA
jgi:hypothetical protein